MPPRKRILYYSHTRQLSGGERVLLTMLETLDRTRYEPMCACPFAGQGNLDEVLRAHGEQVLEAPVLQARFTSNPIKLASYLLSFAKAIRTFRSTILQARPNLIHGNSVRAGIVATLATLGTRVQVLWHVHDDLPAHPISSLIRQLAFRSTRSRFVAVSHATARAFAGGRPFGPRLQVLYNAVNTARFPRKTLPLDREAQSFREQAGVDRQSLLVVAVGMINPRKGLLELIEAWGAFVQDPKAVTARLAIVGAPLFNDDHLYEAKLKTRIRELNLTSITLTGARADVPAILRAADLSVLNASVEPFGLVLLESISSGTPVLATLTGGIPEIIAPDTGVLVPPPGHPLNATELTRAFQDALAHPESSAERATNAFNEVLPQFTLAVFAANLQALYTSLTL